MLPKGTNTIYQEQRGEIMRRNNSFLFIIATWLFIGIVGSAIAQGDKKDLVSRVRAALSPYSLYGLSVSVDTSGTVTIEGTVGALYDRLDIYQIVSRVNGVTGIKDLLDVQTLMLPDDIIKANVERTIKDNSIILEPDKIAVTVDEGVVFLDGTVSYYREKLMATTIASMQDGVKGVENRINVLPSREAKSDENIKSVLEEIVENHFPLVKGDVRIKVANGDVTLDGEVLSLWEKNHLKEEFLKIAGVKSVVENLIVKPVY
jgi:osmotically-inducible protein OsmY